MLKRQNRAQKFKNMELTQKISLFFFRKVKVGYKKKVKGVIKNHIRTV